MASVAVALLLMLVLRRLRAPVALAARSNASLAPAAESTTTAPPPEAAPSSQSASKPTASLADPKPKKADSPDATPEASATRGRRKYPTRRPYINLAHPREWTRPIAPGVLPAYDEALRYIYADSENLAEEAHNSSRPSSRRRMS